MPDPVDRLPPRREWIPFQRHRWWFLGFFVLPFVFVLLFAGMFLEIFFCKRDFWPAPSLEFHYLILLVEILSLIGFYAYRKSIYAGTLPE